MDLSEQNRLNPYRHPWELSRSSCLLNMIQGNPSHFKYADIGAGDLYFAHQLLKLTDQTIHAVDLNAEGKNTESRILMYRHVEELPRHSMDSILMLDVLEHAADDNALLETSLAALKEGASLLITVPAYPFLFSQHDTALKHYRRYTQQQILTLLQRQQLIIDEVFYFYTALFAMRLLQTIKEKFFGLPTRNHGVGGWRLPPNHFATRGIRGLLDWDFRMCRALSKIGLHLPGLSLCVRCRKTSA